MSSAEVRGMEQQIITLAVECLIDAGFRVGVRSSDGFDVIQGPTTDVAAIVDAARTMDEALLTAWQERSFKGSVLLVFGNDGHDVIADNSIALESVLKPASELADQLAESQH